jgi:diguanylate cyclase (GGDEF)-like protein
MTAPSFRRAPGARKAGEPGEGEDLLRIAPFSQAQVLFLLKNEFERARRYGFPLTALLLEVDRFSRLVDLHGSGLRDAVRSGLGRMLGRRLRASDHVGAAAEDRILIVLPHSDTAGARAAAKRLREEFARLEVEAGGHRLPLTLSVGIAGDDAEALFYETILNRAEAALERAAAAGGDRCEVFGENEGEARSRPQ